MPSTHDQGSGSVEVTTLSSLVDEELLLLSRADVVPDDDDIEVVEYEVTLNSLHRAIHVMHSADPQEVVDDGLPDHR